MALVCFHPPTVGCRPTLGPSAIWSIHFSDVLLSRRQHKAPAGVVDSLFSLPFSGGVESCSFIATAFSLLNKLCSFLSDRSCLSKPASCRLKGQLRSTLWNVAPPGGKLKPDSVTVKFQRVDKPLSNIKQIQGIMSGHRGWTEGQKEKQRQTNKPKKPNTCSLYLKAPAVEHKLLSQTPAPALTSCAILGTAFNPCKLQFPSFVTWE